MKIKSQFVTRFGGFAIAQLARHWMKTLDYQSAMYDESVDLVHPDFESPAIFLFWHEYIPFPFYLRGHCDLAMLLSRHQDAEWLSQAARHMGFETIRGSTNRGGVAALRELVSAGRMQNLAITPDGPRGPRRRLAPGAIYLSSKIGVPLIALGFGYDRPWRYRRAWDQFAIPRPYSRARVVVSPPIQIPPDLSREQLDECRVQVEGTLNCLTSCAEQWAESNRRVAGCHGISRQAIPLWRRRARGEVADRPANVPA